MITFLNVCGHVNPNNILFRDLYDKSIKKSKGMINTFQDNDYLIGEWGKELECGRIIQGSQEGISNVLFFKLGGKYIET